MQRAGVQIGAGGSFDLAVFRYDHRLEAAGADIDAHEPHAVHVPLPASAPEIVTSAAIDTDAFTVDERGLDGA
jgi:hypothetical protein